MRWSRGPGHLSQSFVSLAWRWNVALSGPDTLPGLTFQSDGEYLYRIPWNLPYVSHVMIPENRRVMVFTVLFRAIKPRRSGLGMRPVASLY